MKRTIERTRCKIDLSDKEFDFLLKSLEDYSKLLNAVNNVLSINEGEWEDNYKHIDDLIDNIKCSMEEVKETVESDTYDSWDIPFKK